MPRSRTSSGGELLVELRRDDPTPLHRQLERELRSAIRSGRLEAETALPSSRALAGQLGLSRGVIVEAYEQLVAEGYLASRPGGATRVADNVGAGQVPARPARASLPGYQPPEDPPINFAAGRPDVSQFPRQAWMKSLRRVMNETPSERLTYLDPRGAPELRIALASYLNRVRGTIADADAIVICNGFAQAQRLVVQVVREAGGRRIAAEDPGFAEAATAARDHGLEIVPVRVDDEGLDVAMLARADADAVVVTPAHQFPTGAVLSAERRAALVAWAKDRDALILEDDYDAEYRYDREPIGALHGLAPDHVIYAGIREQDARPGPATRLDDRPAAARRGGRGDEGARSIGARPASSSWPSPTSSSAASSTATSAGCGRSTVAAATSLLRALREHLPELRPVGASAGLHVLAWLPPGVDEAAILRRARDAGVGLYGLASYGATDAGRGALDFGYGSVTEGEIVEGVRIVAEALRGSTSVEHAKEASAR